LRQPKQDRSAHVPHRLANQRRLVIGEGQAHVGITRAKIGDEIVRLVSDRNCISAGLARNAGRHRRPVLARGAAIILLEADFDPADILHVDGMAVDVGNRQRGELAGVAQTGAHTVTVIW
jgi:hypothetical protein